MRFQVNLVEDTDSKSHPVLSAELFISDITTFKMFKELTPGNKAKFIKLLLDDITCNKDSMYDYILFNDWLGYDCKDIAKKFKEVAEKIEEICEQNKSE